MFPTKGDAKVGQEHTAILDRDIFRFDVSMANFGIVKILESVSEAGRELLSNETTFSAQ